MEEVLSLADRVTVLRDGRHVGDLDRGDATHEKIVALMVGRELSANYFPDAPGARPRGDRARRREPPRAGGARARVLHAPQRGEILGFAGLVGSGRTELMQAIFGATPALGGSMRLDGKAVPAAQPARGDPPRRLPGARGPEAPRPRPAHDASPRTSRFPAIHGYARCGFLDRARETRVAQAEVARFRVKAPSIRTAAS